MKIGILIVNTIHIFGNQYINGLQSEHIVSDEILFGMSPKWGAIIIPTVAPILVFGIGVLIDKCSSAKTRKTETIAFRDTLFNWIELIQAPVQNQIMILQTFSKAIMENKTLQNESLAFPRNNVDKINIANAENVIKYLMFNSSKPKEDCRAEKIYNLISQLVFLSSLESEILKLYDSYQKESRALYNTTGI